MPYLVGQSYLASSVAGTGLQTKLSSYQNSPVLVVPPLLPVLLRANQSFYKNNTSDKIKNSTLVCCLCHNWGKGMFVSVFLTPYKIVFSTNNQTKPKLGMDIAMSTMAINLMKTV